MQKAFEVMFLTSHKPPGAALFELHGEDLDTSSFFFSPEAGTLAPTLLEAFGAVVSEPPLVTERLVCLVGDDDVLKNLQYRQGTSRTRKQRLHAQHQRQMEK